MTEGTSDPESVVDGIAARVSNWGRWGGDDELGCLNLVTEAKVIEGARCVRKGRVFGLAIPFDRAGPMPQDGGLRFNPIHTMLFTGTDATFARGGAGAVVGFADDMVTMPLQCATQWDSLAHVFHRGHLYNGYPSRFVSALGARKNGIQKIASRIATRGVLLDLPRVVGAHVSVPGHAITVDELEAALAAERVTLGPGDALLVRTGWMRPFLDRRSWDGYLLDRPGLSYTTAEWLHERDVVAVAADSPGVEVRPAEIRAEAPFHVLAIVYMGMLLGEIFDFERLAEDCAEDGTYEFLFVAPAIPITGAVGSPVNPYAIK